MVNVPDPTSSAQLRQLVEEVNQGGGTYHKIDFGGGLVIRGEYDMNKYIHYYGIPADLTGWSVLDIGTSTGFFAFECARRGGDVTAIDVWDGVLFNRVLEALSLSVRYVQKSIYDLDAAFGQFDLVICGSLLLHLRDIFGAIQQIRSVCQNQAIIATAFLEDGRCSDRAYCEFVGNKAMASGGEYWSYWNVTTTALKKMLLASGFSTVCEAARFSLHSEPGGQGSVTPHVVVHAMVGPEISEK